MKKKEMFLLVCLAIIMLAAAAGRSCYLFWVKLRRGTGRGYC